MTTQDDLDPVVASNTQSCRLVAHIGGTDRQATYQYGETCLKAHYNAPIRLKTHPSDIM